MSIDSSGTRWRGFGAFSNITWDLGDDLDQYRDE